MSSLPRDIVDFYNEEGYVFPLESIGRDMAAEARALLEAYVSKNGVGFQAFQGNAYLKIRRLYDVVTHPVVVRQVAHVLGPDILCISATLFAKEPHDEDSALAWHQDGYYFAPKAGPEEGPFLTAWIALTDSTVENGAMRVLPRSQREVIPHGVVPDDTQSVALIKDRMLADVDETLAVPLTLAAGQMSFHHMNIAHASAPNLTSGRRMGLGVRYVTPAFSRGYAGQSALLIKGRAAGDHFNIIPPPRHDDDPLILRQIEIDQELARRHHSYLTPKDPGPSAAASAQPSAGA